MRALVIEAESQETRVIDIPREGALKPLQKAVEGLVQCVALPQNGVEMWLNDEGKLIGLLTNLTATKVWESEYGHTDWIAGNVVFTGPADEEGYITDLDEEVVESLQIFAQAIRAATWGHGDLEISY